MKRILIVGLFLMALFAAALHWRIHPPYARSPEGHVRVHAGKLIGNALMWLDVVVVTALFLHRRTAALAFLLNGVIVIFGSVMMTHYSAVVMNPVGLYGWLVESLMPDVAAAWADFMLGAALWVVYVREGQALGAKGAARSVVPRIRGEHLVIVGSGVAGVTAAEAARRTNPTLAITLLGQEPELPYRRLRLTPYLAGQETRETLLLRPRQWYRDHRINLLTDARVTAVDPEAHTLILRGTMGSLRYDRLVLATGSHPRRLPIEGLNRRNVVVVRTLADADAIMGALREGDACVVIGGGLLGLETAKALALRGGRVQVVEAQDRILPIQLDPRGSERLAEALRREGLGLHVGATLTGVAGEDRVVSVTLSSGTELAADLVVVAVGIAPTTHLAATAKCQVERGVVVDDCLATSVADIYAAGDMAQHQGRVYGIWPAAMAQGEAAGVNAAGGSAPFTGIVPFNPLKVVETRVYSVGATGAERPTDRELVLETPQAYKKLTLRDGRLIGAVLVGDDRESEALAAAIVQGLDLSRAAAGGDVADLLKAVSAHAAAAARGGAISAHPA